ncbi:transporter substrate-binding domain-containing protein [Marinomonas sp. MED121]|uniref:transporter substrate-binding domain-containing protein n=1 Tax=Marinomonas sp. MED121 TaxID=314277 RepID=UPI0006805307
MYRHLLSIIFMSIALVGRADPHLELKIVTENFPPYNFQVEGKAHGMSTEVVKAMLDHANIQADIDFYPWPRAYRTAQVKPNALIYSIARIPERETMFEWIGDIAPYRTSFYKLKENTDLNINSLDDARVYRIGVSQEDAIKTYLENRGFEKLVVANADQFVVRMLIYGRMDLIAYDEASLPFQVKASGFDLNLIERVFRIEGLSEKLYVAMHPQSDPVLVQTLKNSLEAIKLNGTYRAIEAQYFPD